MASGAGYYKIAIMATAISLGCLVGLQYFEKLYQKDSYRVLTVVTTNEADVSHITETIQGKKTENHIL